MNSGAGGAREGHQHVLHPPGSSPGLLCGTSCPLLLLPRTLIPLSPNMLSKALGYPLLLSSGRQAAAAAALASSRLVPALTRDYAAQGDKEEGEVRVVGRFGGGDGRRRRARAATNAPAAADARPPSASLPACPPPFFFVGFLRSDEAGGF